MKLTRVTISGADDKTERKDLDALTREFPFVEWGILLSPSRAGGPRYPSHEGVARLLVGSQKSRTALHLCGGAARTALDGKGTEDNGELRFQVNGFSKWVDEHGLLTPFGQWITRVRRDGSSVILQVHDERALAVAQLLVSVHSNVSILWDQSGGRGILSAWPDPPAGVHMGYAGGITPENVERAIQDLLGRPSEQETWIDMESGVRTNDELDLDKVYSVLKQSAPYVTGAELS